MLVTACSDPVGLYVLILCTIIQFSNTHDTSIYQRREPCGMDKFRCQSGECIEEDVICDGTPECFDNSDETADACSQLQCPRWTFRCNYGACVKLSAQCDGVRDCFDGSDEQGCNTERDIQHAFPMPSSIGTTSRPVLPVNCLIPNNPENGAYTIGGQEAGTYTTGDTVIPYSVLVTNCDYGYQISPPNIEHSVCANGIWTPIPSKCSRYPVSTKSEYSGECNCHCPIVLIK